MRRLIRDHRSLDLTAKLYLASQFLRALYFAWPIWYGFATLALSPLQVGIYFSVAYGVQLLAEVPTGAFADKYGRRRSAIIGGLLLAAVPLLLYLGHNFPAYICAAILSGIGYAFISGSLEALVYDHEHTTKEGFRTVAWLEITFFQVGLIVSTAAGGLLYTMHHSLPFITESAAGLLCVGLILGMRETRTKNDRPQESYARIFKTGLKHLLATKFLRLLVLMGVPVAVIMSLGIDFVNEAQMIEYGLGPDARGLLIAGLKILALIVLNLALYKVLQADRSKLIFIALMGLTIFTLMSLGGLPLFLAGFVLFNWLSASHTSFVRPLIHDSLPSSHRATAMSGYSALIGLGALGANSLAGLLIQTFGTPRAVYAAAAGIFLLVAVPCTWWLANHLRPHHDNTPSAP